MSLKCQVIEAITKLKDEASKVSGKAMARIVNNMALDLMHAVNIQPTEKYRQSDQGGRGKLLEKRYCDFVSAIYRAGAGEVLLTFHDDYVVLMDYVSIANGGETFAQRLATDIA